MEAIRAEAIRRGELEPAELIELAPAAAEDEEGREALYDGVRTTVADLLRSGASQDEAAEWRDVITHLIGIAEEAQSGDASDRALLAARLGTLRDLSADVVAHQTYYSVERLSEFPTYGVVLRYLLEEEGSAQRSAVLQAVGLKQSNGTRVLKLLESARLLRRRRVGAEVMVELTADGRRALSEWTAQEGSDVNGNVTPIRKAKLIVSGGPIEGSRSEQGYPAYRKY